MKKIYSLSILTFFLLFSFSFLIFNFTFSQTYSISGYIKYDGPDSSILKNTRLFLYKYNGIKFKKLDSTFTDINGYYIFKNDSNGTYNISLDIKIPWDGFRARDLLMIRRYCLGLYHFLDPLKQEAADLNGDKKSCTPIDELILNRYFWGLMKTIPNPWLYTNTDFIINSKNITLNIKALCRGDVDGSYKF
jgi:hypothetical protein